jgi:hypothetical protein
MISLAFLLSVTAPDALACAGFYHEDGAMAESDVQRAVFQRTADGVEVSYEVDLDVDTGSFGWVIPAPGAITAIEDGDPDLFRRLLDHTGAIRELTSVSSGGGCAGAAKGGENLRTDNATQSGGVEVVYTGATPTYDYVVLEATSADALESWLADNGWGDGGGAFEGYVSDGGWQFAAIKLSMDVDQLSRATLPPLTLRYEGEALVFPSRMALQAMETVSTVVFVLGDQRARVSAGWGEVELDLVWDDGEDPDYIEYVAYPEAVASIGSDRAFALTFAGPWEDGWVTRFETVAAPSVHVKDAEFAVDAGEGELHTVLSNEGGCNTPEGAAFALALPLLAFVRRRRTGE